jgi:CSLREA domain-containing protein
LEVLEDRTVLSAATYLVNLIGDAGTGSGTSGDIRYCINQADKPANAGSTITFDTSALGSNLLTLTKGQLVITDDMTKSGPGASNLTLSGNNASRVFNINATTAQVSISGLTITGGVAAYGGGITNDGNLTLSGSMLSANSATISGGGIRNGGTLNVSICILADNSAPANGGGIFNSGSLTISSSTLSGNIASQGGGLMNSGLGTLTVNDSTLAGNRAAYGGGLWSNGAVTVTASTLSGNSATSGGGINNIGKLQLNNSTLSGNSAQYVGGLFNASGTATLTNTTLAQNSASISTGGIDAYAGDVLLHNTLVAANELKNASVNKPSDVAYSLDSASDYSLIGNGSGGLSAANHNLLGSVAKPLNPLLQALGDHSGSTQTMTLLPGSVAIDAGSSSYGGSTDQRGKSRVNAPDIGAFESQGFTIAVTSGNNQSAIVTTAFANPLVVSVTANNPLEPVSGGVISFTAPASDASVVLKGSPAVIGSDGKASVTATANATDGTYTVSASATGITTPANFTLSNTTPPILVVTTLTDENAPNDGTTSLREAIAIAEKISAPETITFDKSILAKSSGNLIDLQSALPDLTGNITIEGPGTNVLTVQRDSKAAAFSIFTVDKGATAVISGLTITGGSTSTNGGGIDNAGSLTVTDSTLSGNSANNRGGGIYNAASLTVNGSTLSGNTDPGGGGGIWNDGSLTVSGSTLSANADTGLVNFGSMTLSDSTLSGNSTWGDGGGIFNHGTLTVSDSTLSGNSAAYNQGGGGIYNAGSLTVSGSTLSGNNATNGGGGIEVASGDVLLHNTLIAGNGGSDVSGTLDSASDYNLIGDGSGGLSTAKHNLLGVNPLLAPLGNYGGPTQTMALLPDSPAIDAGSSAYGGSTDQRGKPRVGATDIGAFESQGFTIAVSSGNNQSAPTYTPFADPLVVSVTAKNSVEPVAGGAITFTAPASGASAGFVGGPATIGSDGKASVTAVANATTGTYTVNASATGVASPAKFSLSNTVGPTSLVVTTLLDANVPSGKLSLREAIAIADAFSSRQTITFDPSILTEPTGNVIDLQSALPDLTANVTIQGPGANVLTVQRDAKDAAFSVFTVDKGATATISGLTISGGSATQGGGIDNLGSLTVSDSTLSGNTATGNDGGGGIDNLGSLTVSDSTLSSNSAQAGGGLLNYIGASLLVSDCTFQANNAVGAGGLMNASATATVQSSTFVDNTAAHDGGGLYNGGTGAELQVTDCTIADNHVGFGGGGIYVYLGQMLTVANTTITGNTADYRGGIYFDQGNVTLQNSIVAGNTGYDLLSSGSGTSLASFSLIQNDGTGLKNGSNGNIIGVNPLLAPLGNYGGATQTMALLPGSPAIDAGSSSYGGSTDQRGKPRVGATDIGAFESQGFTIAVSSGNNQSANINTAFANPLVVSVKANNAVEPVAGGAITFTAPANGASAVFTGSPATIGSEGMASVTTTANGTTGSYTVSASATGIASPAKFTLTNTAAASPALTLPTPALTSSPAALSLQETSDQLWAELGRNWDLLLAGDNVHELKNNPQAETGF